MTGNEYQKLAMKTMSTSSTESLTDAIYKHDVCHNKPIGTKTIDMGAMIEACLGLTGEAGEVSDCVKKWIFQGHKEDFLEIKKELADVMWYAALLCQAFAWDMDDIFDLSLEKINARYRDGFSEKASIERVDVK